MEEYINTNIQLNDVAEKEMILAKLTELPPDDLIKKAWTEDQVVILVKSDSYCKILHTELKAVFSGKESQLNGLSEETKEFYSVERDYYLKMYFLFREAWGKIINLIEVLPDSFIRAIEEAIKQQKFDNTLIENYKLFFKNICREMMRNYPFRNPGELLAAIIENDVRADIIPFLQGRFDLNFRKLNRLVLELDRKKQAGESSKELQKIEKKIKKLLGKDINELLKLKNFCINICAYAAMDKKDKTLTKAYKSYLTAREERETLLLRKFRNTPALCWEKGQRRYYTQKGGTLISSS